MKLSFVAGSVLQIEAIEAYADAVIFKSSLGTAKGDFIQALQTLSEGGVKVTAAAARWIVAVADTFTTPSLD